MSTRTSPEVLFASANVAHPSMGLWTPGRIADFAAAAGFDGVEWHPIYWPSPLVPVKGLAVPIRSLHQSFRVGRKSVGTNLPAGAESSLVDRSINSPLGRVLSPEMTRSAKYMGHLQVRLAAAGGRVPGVYYPNPDPGVDKRVIETGGASANVFQPTDHAARLMGARNLEDFYAAARARGYSLNPFCVDTYHYQRKYRTGAFGIVSDIEQSLPFIAHGTEYAHISLGRTDIGGEDHIETEDDLGWALNGEKFQGATGSIISALASTGMLKHAVVEVVAGSLANPKSQKDLVAQYATLAAVTRQALAQ